MPDKVAEQTRHAERFGDLAVGQVVFLLHIHEHGGQHTAAAAGGRGDDGAVSGILLGNGKGVGADKLKLPHLRQIEQMRPLIEVFGLALDVQPAGQDALGSKPIFNRLAHDMPDVLQKAPDLRAFVQFDVFRQRYVPPLTEARDLGKGIFGIDLGICMLRFALDNDVAAANGFHTDALRLLVVLVGDEVERVRVLHVAGVDGSKDDLRGVGRKRVDEDAIRPVADAVENDFIAIGLRRHLAKQFCRALRTHGV